MTSWWAEQYGRKWAATADRSLGFARINWLLGDRPPTVIPHTGHRLFLFKSGHDRDLFVETFYKDYEARAYGSSTY